MDYGLDAQLPARGADLRKVYFEREAERQGRRPIPERLLRE